MQIFSCEGNIVDIQKRAIFWGRVHVSGERITEIEVLGEEKRDKNYLMPGFVDAHVHIESSMLTPSNFARMAVCHGTVGTVSDPHEIANVLGVEGVEYMIDNGKQVPFNFAFGAPSCVPATVFETAGATIDSLQVADLLSKPEIKYLAEMMNYPGVIYNDPEVMAKLHAAHIAGKPIDGHAPGLIGEDAIQYFSQNISTDHECYQYEEAKFKLSLGVKILIREGSAAKNFKTLIPLAHDHWENMMFCSDDKHPDDLILGHINLLVARAIKEEKLDLFKALTMACINPVVHYQLQIGQLRKQDFADFIMVKDLLSFEVIATYIKGNKVAEYGQTQIPAVESKIVNHFEASPVNKSILSHPIAEQIRVIHAHDGQLITSSAWLQPKVLGDECVSDVERDLLKIVVYN
nr:adenine deaminase [Saprospiraceae bacterium]